MSSKLCFSGKPDSSFTFFSVFMVYWTASSLKHTELIMLKNCTSQASQSLGVVIMVKTMLLGRARQFVHIVLSFHGLLEGIKSKI